MITIGVDAPGAQAAARGGRPERYRPRGRAVAGRQRRPWVGRAAVLGGYARGAPAVGHRGPWKCGRRLAQHLVGAGEVAYEVNPRWPVAGRRGARQWERGTCWTRTRWLGWVLPVATPRGPGACWWWTKPGSSRRGRSRAGWRASTAAPPPPRPPDRRATTRQPRLAGPAGGGTSKPWPAPATFTDAPAHSAINGYYSTKLMI